MTSKIRIKVGDVEFEYEGETKFSKDEIKDLFAHLESFSATGKIVERPNPPEGGRTANGGIRPLHTSTIASRLDAKGAQKVVLAAAAHLQLIEGKESFSRQELLTDMKTATMHYKATMSSNLSNTLQTMVSQGAINQISADAYSLTETKHAELERLVAGQS
ncbi:hypothetical protein [Methylocystis sp. SC2]|uniref:hypothetical protein n=1 Tax=Methylocystis sp. (strain SC2) TaxID=187303 RepID=UPI00027AF2BF|nr:hypothetical protein [Methylocystis sp. SC2]CCJ07177.1 Uncharacterized protein BN69_1726 [Methylocystis sp. SC2]